MLRKTVFLAIFMLLPLAAGMGQITQNYEWTAIGNPEWVNAVDVAFGGEGDDQLAWHRYMIGTNETDKNLYKWEEVDPEWIEDETEYPYANKIISYREGSGDIAFMTSYEDQVYWTTDGGDNWDYVAGSYNLANKQFNSVDINWGEQGTQVYVGCAAMQGEASVYKGIYAQGQWTWDRIGDGLGGKTVYDFEYGHNNKMACGTDAGIFRKLESWDWEYIDVYAGDVVCMEALEHEDEFWAATGEEDVADRRLFYTGDGWDTFEEIRLDAQEPFGHTVNDIAAIYLYHQTERPYQSVYVATDDGLYLLAVEGTEVPVNPRTLVDFQAPDCPYDTPFETDSRITSLDYYQTSSESDTRYIMVGTTRDIYLLTETRGADQSQITAITCTDISAGTFWTEEAKAAYKNR